MGNPESFDDFDDADIIASYSRAEAIADGALVDVTRTAKEAGFTVPVALTAAVHARLEPSERDVTVGQSLEGRLWDVLMVLRFQAKVDTDIVIYQVLVAEEGEQHTLYLKAVIGPGDEGEPVITIMFEHED